MSQSYTEITHESHPKRVVGSIFWSFIAALFLVALFFMFIHSEHHLEINRQGLNEAGKKVTTINTDSIDENNNGKVVHLTGKISSTETLRDPIFRFSFNTLKVERRVEMYQWDQDTRTTEHVQTGGSSIKEKSYTYNKVWSCELIDSNHFRMKQHRNPKRFKIQDATFTVNDAKTGKFLISNTHINNIDPCEYSIKDLSTVPKGKYAGRLHLTSKGEVYIGENPTKPKIGDHRISYFVANKAVYSLIGEQNKHRIKAYQASSGANIAVIKEGKEKAEELIKIEKKEQNKTKWIVRLIIFVFYVFMIYLILNPIAVLADIIPRLGFYKRKTNFATALAIAISLSIFSINIGKYHYIQFMAKSADLGEKIIEKATSEK